jgi:hypothetical protein
VEILSRSRRERLFTLFNSYLKSHFVPFNTPDPVAEQDWATLRRRQCAIAAEITAAETRPNSRFLSRRGHERPARLAFLEALAAAPKLNLVFGLAQQQGAFFIVAIVVSTLRVPL